MSELSLGMALSRHRLTIADMDPNGGVESVALRTTSTDPETVLGEVARLITDRYANFNALGVSIGGHVDSLNGMVLLAPDLVHAGVVWRNVPVSELLSQELGVPVYVSNDVNCMALHAVVSRDKAPANFAVVYLAQGGDGLGSCSFSNGLLVTGCTGGAGELGHIVIQPTGARCRCGNRGCLEALLSAEAIVREVNWGSREVARTLVDVLTLAEEGDLRATEAVRKAGRSLGQGLAVLNNLTNPERIYLGGGHEFIGNGKGCDRPNDFWEEMHQSFEQLSFGDMANYCAVESVSLGIECAALGSRRLRTILSK